MQYLRSITEELQKKYSKIAEEVSTLYSLLYKNS